MSDTLAPSLSILEALDNEELFAPHFRSDTWRPWRAFLATLYALPLQDEDLALFRACTGRSAPPSKAFTEAALIVGRRGGKSRILALIAVFLACFRDYTPYLAPGEVATVIVLAASRSQARSIFRYVNGLLDVVPVLAGMIESVTDDQVILSNRVVIEIGTASWRFTRGYTFAAILADEVAFWRSDESANPDVEILRALRPGMDTIPGSKFLLASSPYAKKGALYNAFRRHYGRDDGRVLVWKAATEVMNARIDPAIIREAYEEDPESARAEYGAEFRDDLADFVTREIVDAVTCLGRHELPPMPGAIYFGFCDPSGGVSDAMTLAIGHLRDGEVCVLDTVLEIRPPFDPEKAVAECAAVLKRYGITRIVGDRYAGEWPRARFHEHGIDFEQSARPKSDLYHDLLPLLNAKRVELLENSRLTSQLVGLERRVSRSGKDSIDHAPNGHDDIANCVAGVLVGLDLDRRPPLIARRQMGEALAAPLPKVVMGTFATIATDQRGRIAVAYCAVPIPTETDPVRLFIVDFDVDPPAGSLFHDTMERNREIGSTMIVANATRHIFTRQDLIGPGEARRPDCTAIPDEFQVVNDALLIRAAGYVADGMVRICGPAVERSRTAPLHASFDFRPGDDLSGKPLQLAVLQSIILMIERAP